MISPFLNGCYYSVNRKFDGYTFITPFHMPRQPLLFCFGLGNLVFGGRKRGDVRVGSWDSKHSGDPENQYSKEGQLLSYLVDRHCIS